MSTTALIEAFDLTEATIGREKRTVRQRIIASGLSQNGRLYAEDILRNAAPLFENAKTFINHPTKADMKDRPERDVRDITGWLTEVTYENGALYATRHFTDNDAGKNTWALVEQIVLQKAPKSLIGASINAIGKGRVEKQDGRDVVIVESIVKVVSVDDVTTPAAGGEYLPLVASDDGSLTHELLKTLDFDEWREAQPDYVERLKKEWKTVRLDEETKRVLAESAENGKAISARAEQLQADLIAVQEALATSQQVSESAISDLDTARRELLLEKALRAASLPTIYEDDLRVRLLKESPDTWAGIISTERTKAKNSTPARVNVNGAGQQVQTTVQAIEAFNPLPFPHENQEQWQARQAANRRNKQ